MRILTVEELLTEEIDLRNVGVFPIRESLGREGNYTDAPRSCSVFFLYLQGERLYTLPDGSTFTLTPGDVLYVPQSARYRFRITAVAPDGLDDAIAVNFEMKDPGGNGVSTGEVPVLLPEKSLPHPEGLFRQALREDRAAFAGRSGSLKLRSIVYLLCHEIFGALRQRETEKKPWHPILPAIAQIEADPAADVPIPLLAKECGISETGFRQLFRLYTGGESPVAYRNRLRIELAERMLQTERVTVECAARAAGFRDMSHYYRLYKRYSRR